MPDRLCSQKHCLYQNQIFLISLNLNFKTMKNVVVGALLGVATLTACGGNSNSTDKAVIDTDTVIESDTTIQQTIIETDTSTRTIEGGEGQDTIR